MSSNLQRIELPGFDLPLEIDHSRLNRPAFPHAIDPGFQTSGVTLRELRMLDFINQITDKPSWQDKIENEEIVAKWRQEACGTETQQKISSKHLSGPCFDYCMAELGDKAKYLEKYGVINVLDVKATIVKSDLDPNDAFFHALQNAAAPLEAVPDREKDWHPGSDQTVLDLIHPSLFPVTYGRTRALRFGTVDLLQCSEYIGCGEVIPIPYVLEGRIDDFLELESWSSYQWLPSDIRLREDGTAGIRSYINNLHPSHHPQMYRVLETAVQKALPLWNECLSWWDERLRIQLDNVGVKDYKQPERSRHMARENVDEELELSETSDEDYLVPEWLRDHEEDRQIHHPSPTQPFVSFEQNMLNNRRSRLNLQTEFVEGIQVIFKLASIYLTPEKPEYDGSRWHIEGALNEHICATALFYLDQENIDDNYLEFRSSIDAEEMRMKPGQDEYIAAEDIYGIKNEERCEQHIGRVFTRPGRILAFPNVMQHRVQPFALADRSKTGHRKILAMFLIDPSIRVLSTSNVPPQRRDWWAEEIRKIGCFAELPLELFDRIIDEVEDFPIAWKGPSGALAMRKKLMKERGRINEEFEETLAENTFSFCEH